MYQVVKVDACSYMCMYMYVYVVCIMYVCMSVCVHVHTYVYAVEPLLKDTLSKGHNTFNLSIKDKLCGLYRTICMVI